jgi:hypothetical protein
MLDPQLDETFKVNPGDAASPANEFRWRHHE